MTPRLPDIPGRLRDALPTLPRLGRDVAIPVYMIHNSPDAEDYFFLVDFEEFVERSGEGMFVRPRLKIWAGRTDFDRQTFARHFRKVFQGEFDRMRQELARPRGRRGWLDWDLGLMAAPQLLTGFVANLFLLIAVSAGKALLPEIRLPGWLRGKSAAVALEDDIARTRDRVDDALTRIDVVLHRELHAHAWRGTEIGPLSGMDYDAWPLPAHVRSHIGDRQSGSWW